MLQPLLRDGYELRLVVRRTARLGIPLRTPWPQHVALAVTHAVDAPLQFLVGVDRHFLGKLLIVHDAAKTVLSTVFRVLRTVDEPCQHLALHGLCLVPVSFQFPLSGEEDFTCYSC